MARLFTFLTFVLSLVLAANGASEISVDGVLPSKKEAGSRNLLLSGEDLAASAVKGPCYGVPIGTPCVITPPPGPAPPAADHAAKDKLQAALYGSPPDPANELSVGAGVIPMNGTDANNTGIFDPSAAVAEQEGVEEDDSESKKDKKKKKKDKKKHKHEDDGEDDEEVEDAGPEVVIAFALALTSFSGLAFIIYKQQKEVVAFVADKYMKLKEMTGKAEPDASNDLKSKLSKLRELV